MAAAKITQTVSVKWTKDGDSVGTSASTTVDQVGNAVSAEVQNISTTTVALDLGEVTGTKYLSFKNFVDKAVSPTAVVYVDTVTPVVPSAATAIHVQPGSPGILMVTTQDTWYAICPTGGPADLGTFAFEV
jgi:hypothetical protein